MRIFITGGTGFIGPYVVNQLLKNGHNLLLLSYEEEELTQEFLTRFKDAEFISGNLSNISKWQRSLINFDPELTIHMAWQGIPDYKAVMSVKNLQYSLNLYLTLARIGCKRVLTTGSCWEYGKTEGKLSERMISNPNSPFTAAKNALRMMGEEIAKENSMQFIWTRFFYVYGPGQKESSIIPHIITSVLNNVTPQVKTPDSKNDFIFVEDVANAIAMIISNCMEQQAIYNIGSGYSISVRKLIEIAYKKSNIPLPTGIFDKSLVKNNIVNFWADITQIQSEIGWKPKVDIEEGIEKMLTYYGMR